MEEYLYAADANSFIITILLVTRLLIRQFLSSNRIYQTRFRYAAQVQTQAAALIKNDRFVVVAAFCDASRSHDTFLRHDRKRR